VDLLAYLPNRDHGRLTVGATLLRGRDQEDSRTMHAGGEGGSRLDPTTLVVAATPHANDELGESRRDVVCLCQKPRTVAEVSARMDLPLGAGRAIVDHLLVEGYLTLCAPSATPAEVPGPDVLRAVLNGLRRL
jgi:hypothetical protein